MRPSSRNPSFIVGLLLLGASALACSGQKIEPQVATSAAETSYALDHAARLQSSANEYVNGEGEVRRITTDFPRYPDQLKDPSWPTVIAIATQADQTGRSRAYVDARHEMERTQAFFNQEREEITRRVAGPTTAALKKNECVKKNDCDVDISGTVSFSLKEAVERQSERRLRAHSEAHALIDANREALGKANAATLEKQADDIATASYLAFIHSIELKARATLLVDEASQVRRTLDRAANQERAPQAQARSSADKKAADERIARIEAAKVRLDGTLPRVQALVSEIDQRNDQLRNEYVRAFDALERALSSKSASK